MIIEFSNVPSSHQPGLAPNQPGPRFADRAPVSDQADTVEVSSVGQDLARTLDESTFRLARVRSLRAEIQSGLYETPKRLEGTTTRLLDVLA